MSDNDFCDDLLGPPPPGQTPGLRQRLLDRTTKALRRRRWMRRLGWAAALAVGCLGAVLFLTLRPAPAPTPTPTPPPPDKDGPAPPVVEQSRPSAHDLEWVAVEDSERRAEPYRAAGDRYLTEHGDLDAALRCYGEALNRGGDEALAINPEDSWLLMMIKDARMREKNDAKNGG
jgi:hypothetical protein